MAGLLQFPWAVSNQYIFNGLRLDLWTAPEFVAENGVDL